MEGTTPSGPEIPIMKHFMPILFGLICSVAVSQAQPNFYSAMPVAGERTGSMQWTVGELFSGYRAGGDGASLTEGFIQPMLAMATDLRPRLERARITAFPIPARDYLTVQFDKTTEWTLFLFDLRGRMLFSWEVRSAKTDIPLADLRPGVYLLRVLDAGRRSQVIRFIKH